MKVLYRNLGNQSIRKLIVNSLDGCMYQAIVVINDQEFVVWENDDKCLLSPSVANMEEAFEHLNIQETVLRHESYYDEMIGLPIERQSNRMEVPLRHL